MIEDLVLDRLWERVAPLLPPLKPRRHRYPGRRPVENGAALAGIVSVQDGDRLTPAARLAGRLLGIPCWRRLRDWTEAGVGPALLVLLLAELRAAGELNLGVGAIDGSHVRALKGGTTSGRHRSTAAAPAPSTTI